MSVTQRWYKHYTRGTSVMQCLREGLGGPESVSQITGLCKCWLCVGQVEKLGKGLRQPDEGRSQLLGYSLCGQLIFDVVV